mmetsp:Transcript_33741/g.70141  ORF Transcript_33741/g.70141 Transcript_33741/m.70141 type:complete len:218 (+) Transcript_33741:47-700(+)
MYCTDKLKTSEKLVALQAGLVVTWTFWHLLCIGTLLLCCSLSWLACIKKGIYIIGTTGTGNAKQDLFMRACDMPRDKRPVPHRRFYVLLICSLCLERPASVSKQPITIALSTGGLYSAHQVTVKEWHQSHLLSKLDCVDACDEISFVRELLLEALVHLSRVLLVDAWASWQQHPIPCETWCCVLRSSCRFLLIHCHSIGYSGVPPCDNPCDQAVGQK